MSRGRKRSAAPVREATPAPLPLRQRQKLIDATISALHLYGPTGTTVARVVAIARLSPGIVRFYFRSKAAMLVAALQFLATEFEERVMIPVAAVRERPALALERLVDLYLDPDIASPRKVAVWYAFWGEASARQEYLAICGQKDASFAALVRDLMAGMIEASGRRHLDADAVALGLIGVLEMLWQGIAFEEEATIDRAAARRRCMAYLRSVFPREFAGSGVADGRHAVDGSEPVARDDDAPRTAWYCVGHAGELSQAGACLTAELAATRVLVVRDEEGRLRAFRNACRQHPHTLVTARNGRIDGRIACTLHGLEWDLAGRAADGPASAALDELDLEDVSGLLFVRASGGASGTAPGVVPDLVADVPTPWECIPHEQRVDAHWRTVVEQWLESRFAGPASVGIDSAGRTLTATEAGRTLRQFCWPATLIERHAQGVSVLQALPDGTGRCRVQQFDYAVASRSGKDTAAEVRDRREALGRELALAESTQRGYADPDYEPDAHATPAPAVAAFRRMASARRD